MIEMPRACLAADKIAEDAEFFSFGTNDLTQMTFGFSRDDINGFLPTTCEQDPAASIRSSRSTSTASANWSRWASRRAAQPQGEARPSESAASAASTAAIRTRSSSATRSGLDYVSCSPFRVPIARLAAAQAALGETKRDK